MIAEKENKFLIECQKHNLQVYLVGGATRHLFLNDSNHNDTIIDEDFASNATFEELKNIFKDITIADSKLYSFRIPYQNKNYDLTLFRQEGEYKKRRPIKSALTPSLFLDSYRRDFTVNAIYMDANNAFFDYQHGIEDCQNRVLRMIGNPYVRLKEDPLRIIRGLRFASDYSLIIDPSLKEAIQELLPLTKTVSQNKLQQEISKSTDIKKLEELIDSLSCY